MRSILFTIPLDGRVDLGPLGQVPVFGVGLLLAIWLLVGAGYVIAVVRRHGWQHLGWIVPVVWAVVATAIIKAADWKTLPVYGYGTMLFFRFMAAAALAAKRLRPGAHPGE